MVSRHLLYMDESGKEKPMGRRYVLGLDIGIASVGWAALALDDTDNPYRIINMGSRIFDAAEHPKDGASLAAPRREARSARRRLRRRHHRIERTRHLLIREGLLTKDTLQHLFDAPPEKDVYTLRLEGLDRRLDPEEWARVLLFFAKHRGFRSNRIADDEAGDEGKVLSAIRQNEKLLQGYRTIGEMLAKDPKFAARKRNKAEDYQLTVSRSMLEKEIQALFAAQRQQNNPHASEAFAQEYLEIFSSQRHFDEGPGGESPYGGNQIEKMIGRCTLEPQEKRAPKASYSFQRFSLLQNINHLRILSKGAERALSDEERRTVEALCWKSPSVTYQKIRKELNLPEDAYFKGLYYGKAPDEVEKKAKFSYTAAYHEIRKALDKWKKNGIKELDARQLDTIGYAFTVYKNDDHIRDYLCTHEIPEAIAEALIKNLKSFQKFGHISIKACQKLIPFLEQGMGYYDACKAAGYAAPDAAPKKFLSGGMEEIREIPNPVVRRSISQTVKVINAVIREYGSPVEVHIELAREMARSYQDRQKMKKEMDDHQERNEAIKKELQELGLRNPKGQDIIKWRLYKEQNGFCAYSQKQFDVERSAS
jgi:CRISPR-associated endonuclease Csn1